VRRLSVLCALVAAVVLAAQAGAAGVRADPLSGTWRVTRGGSGSFSVARAGGVLGFFAKGRFRLACLTYDKGDTVGFAELPSKTRLPRGTYSANFGVTGQGCSFNIRLKLSGRKLTGTVLYSEDGVKYKPFLFARP
jgi:hypothetical protein